MSVGAFELEEDAAAVAQGRARVGEAASSLASGHQRVAGGVRRAGEQWTGPRSAVFEAAAHGVLTLLARSRTDCAEVEAALGALAGAVRRAEDELGRLRARYDAAGPSPLELFTDPGGGLLGEAEREREDLRAQAAEVTHDLHRSEQRTAHQIDAVTDRLVPHLSRLSPADAARRVASGADTPPGVAAASGRLVGALLVGPDGSLHPAPDTGASAVQVHDWWTGLSRDQRAALLEVLPEHLGNLDGIPVLDRDTANRAVLPHELAALRAELHALGDAPPEHLPGFHLTDTNPDWARWRLRHDDLLDRIAGTASIASALAGTGPRAYLVGYQPRHGRGRAVVAFGDPDTSAHTVVYVPGTGSRLGTVGEGITRARRIGAAVRASGPSGSVASVAWYGYDAPATLTHAASLGSADRGAPLLDRFVRGLAATSSTPRQHVTVAGHSYGTTLIGRSASHGRRLLADDLFLLASPGMGVGSGWAGHGVLRGTVDDLHLRGPSRGHVFASTARDDPIKWVRGTHLGEDPVDPASGVVAVGATPTGHHDSYFLTADNPALRGLGLVGAGHRDRVRRATRADNASAFDDAPEPTPLGPLLPGWRTP